MIAFLAVFVLASKQLENMVNQKEAKLFVGWVSGSVTHAGVGFHASTQPTFILYLIPPTHLGNPVNQKQGFIFLCWFNYSFVED